MWPCSLRSAAAGCSTTRFSMSSRHTQLITYMALSTMAPQPEEMVSSSGSTLSPCRQRSQWAGCQSCQGDSYCSQRQTSTLPCSTCRHNPRIGQTHGRFCRATDAAATGRAACCTVSGVAVGKTLDTPQPEMLQPTVRQVCAEHGSLLCSPVLRGAAWSHAACCGVDAA